MEMSFRFLPFDSLSHSVCGFLTNENVTGEQTL